MQLSREMREIRQIIMKLCSPFLKDVKKVVDVGGGVKKETKDNTSSEVSYYRDLFENNGRKYVSIDIDKRADICCDLNKLKRLPFRDRSIDLVIFSMVIEHIFDPRHLCEEIGRISKRYILFGVPSMLVWDSRLSFLIGKVRGMSLLTDYTGHHHLWNDSMTQDVLKNYFKEYRIIRQINHTFFKGGGFLPFRVRFFLANFRPTLFASHRYYLLKRKI